MIFEKKNEAKVSQKYNLKNLDASSVKINQHHAKELFVKNPVWKSLLIIAFPGIIVALMGGLFIFISQLMSVDLIPIDKIHTNAWVWNHDGYNYTTLVHEIQEFNKLHPNRPLPIYNIQDIIKSANSFATPITMIVTATVLLSSQGAAVIYSKVLGVKQYRHATDVYYEATITSMLFGALMCVILFGVSKVWIEGQAHLPHDYSSIDNAGIQYFYKRFASITIQWATNFMYIYLTSLFFQGYTLICTYFLNAEGRYNIPMIIVITCDVLGILATFFLIYFARLALNGVAIATVITYLLNMVVFLIYIDVLERKNLTCISTRAKPIIEWDWKEVWMIVYIGSGNFFKNMSIAFTASFSLQILNGVNESINGASHALFYSSVNGIVLPLYNLVYLAMIGIVRAARSIMSYVYGMHDFKKVREAYWYTFMYTTIWSIFLFFFVVFFLAGFEMPGSWGTHGPVILIFNLQYAKNPVMYHAVQYVLMIYVLQFPFFGFANAGELLFQGCEKPFWGIIVSLTLGVFVLFPVLFIMKAISLHVHSVQPSLWVPAVDGMIASGIIGLISVPYLYTKFRKEEIRTLAQDKAQQAYKDNLNKISTAQSSTTNAANDTVKKEPNPNLTAPPLGTNKAVDNPGASDPKTSNPIKK